MQPCWSRSCALLLVAACGHEGGSIDPDAPLAPDGEILDGAVADSAYDGGVDAPPDGAPDDTAPSIVRLTPAPDGDAWLHEPFRVELDEPIATGAQISATLAGTKVNATITREGDRTLRVALDTAAAGLGALALRVTGVRDLAGNAAAPIEVAYTIAPWSRPAIDRGAGAAAPALAVTDTGAVVAAWMVGPAGQRKVVISQHGRGAWEALGGPLGAADVTSPSVAVDADGIVVAWVEGGSARAARWTGSWTELPSPGTGARVVLAGGAGIVGRGNALHTAAVRKRTRGKSVAACRRGLALGR